MHIYILFYEYNKVKINFILMQFKNIGAKIYVANRTNAQI
jgi:hypothetical protein